MTSRKRTSDEARPKPGKPRFFATPALFRAWLEAHHTKEVEVMVGFYKKESGKVSITWPESVDEALCFGWIDGVRRSLGDDAYVIRFTPRRPTSIWSAVNVHWVISAKREETRDRRLDQLIRDSAAGRRIGPLTRPTGARDDEART